MWLGAHIMLHQRCCASFMVKSVTFGVLGLSSTYCLVGYHHFGMKSETEQGIFEQVIRGELDYVSEPWPSFFDGAKDLVRKMLVRDPKKRPTAHEVLCHPWMKLDGSVPDKPLDSAVLSRLKQFSAMHKLKKIAIRIIVESLSEDEIAGLKQMFKMIDTDNSGNITLEELQKGLEKVGANLMESEIHDLLESADLDNSGTIDYTEFIAAMLHLNKAQKEDHMFVAFTYFDKDGSGYITADELQQACEQFGLGSDQLEVIMHEVDKDNVLILFIFSVGCQESKVDLFLG